MTKRLINEKQTLLSVIRKLSGRNVNGVEFRLEQLQGGTLGDVKLVSGQATDEYGLKLPFQVVWKTQGKWQRPFDKNSWRREYDLYNSKLDSFFADSFRWPVCYHMESSENEIQLWMEYIDGSSGMDLTIGMLEQASFELGRFQGRIYNQADLLKDIINLADVGFMASEFSQWHSQTYSYEFLISDGCRIPGFIKKMLKNQDIELHNGKSLEYGYLRSRGCDLADHLRQMLIDIDEQKEELFLQFKRLPVVLCHRDFWNENIISSDGKIRLIDWDTTGWGYIGEDIASLIIDETDPAYLDLYMQKLIPAYLEGLSEYTRGLRIDPATVIRMILVKFGYRILQDYMFSEEKEVQQRQAEILQKIYELKYKYS